MTEDRLRVTDRFRPRMVGQDATAVIDDAPRTPASGTRRLRLLLLQIDLLLDFGRPKEALERSDPQAALNARAPEVMSAELVLRRAASQFALGRLDETLTTLLSVPRPAPTRSLRWSRMRACGRC